MNGCTWKPGLHGCRSEDLEEMLEDLFPACNDVCKMDCADVCLKSAARPAGSGDDMDLWVGAEFGCVASTTLDSCDRLLSDASLNNLFMDTAPCSSGDTHLFTVDNNHQEQVIGSTAKRPATNRQSSPTLVDWQRHRRFQNINQERDELSPCRGFMLANSNYCAFTSGTPALDMTVPTAVDLSYPSLHIPNTSPAQQIEPTPSTLSESMPGADLSLSLIPSIESLQQDQHNAVLLGLDMMSEIVAKTLQRQEHVKPPLLQNPWPVMLQKPSSPPTPCQLPQVAPVNMLHSCDLPQTRTIRSTQPAHMPATHIEASACALSQHAAFLEQQRAVRAVMSATVALQLQTAAVPVTSLEHPLHQMNTTWTAMAGHQQQVVPLPHPALLSPQPSLSATAPADIAALPQHTAAMAAMEPTLPLPALHDEQQHLMLDGQHLTQQQQPELNHHHHHLPDHQPQQLDQQQAVIDATLRLQQLTATMTPDQAGGIPSPQGHSPAAGGSEANGGMSGHLQSDQLQGDATAVMDQIPTLSPVAILATQMQRMLPPAPASGISAPGTCRRVHSNSTQSHEPHSRLLAAMHAEQSHAVPDAKPQHAEPGTSRQRLDRAAPMTWRQPHATADLGIQPAADNPRHITAKGQAAETVPPPGQLPSQHKLGAGQGLLRRMHAMQQNLDRLELHQHELRADLKHFEEKEDKRLLDCAAGSPQTTRQLKHQKSDVERSIGGLHAQMRKLVRAYSDVR